MQYELVATFTAIIFYITTLGITPIAKHIYTSLPKCSYQWVYPNLVVKNALDPANESLIWKSLERI